MSAVFIGVVVYLLAQLALGFYVARKVSTEEDYLLAGRSLGYGLTIFSVFATWFGAETCIGAAGRAYEGGLSETLSDPFGYTAALIIFGLVFAAPLWRRKLTTLADLFHQRWGAGVERLAVLLLVPSSVLWAAAQIRGFGHVLSLTSDMSPTWGISIAAVVVVAYTSKGGLLADAWTDLVQGVVLIAGIVALGIAIVVAGDGGVLQELPRERLTLHPADASILDIIEAWSAPIMGSMVAQELVQRALAARSGEVARTGTLIASGMYFVIGLIPAVIGLMAWRLLGDGAESETVLVQMAYGYLPTALVILFAGALVSAILSTVNTALLVAGSLVAHNVFLPLRPDADERLKLRANRVAVIVCGAVAYLLARGSDSAYELVEEAAALGTAGVFVTFVFALWSSFGGRRAAYAALVVGTVVYVGGSRTGTLPQPYITAVAAALVAYVAGGLLDRRNSRILR
ncbi:MAG TPA: sodium:solute symporter family protein [Kofleriaceae bacterium]|nr:sodium:solute symporter family protein [Kofleriaceae bacterium]